MKFILILIILSFSHSSFAIDTCSGLLSSSFSVQKQAPILTQHGDTYWGFYQCNSCDTRVSAKPNVHGDQACVNCGVPHTDEKYTPPAMFKKGGELYLVDPGRLIRDDAEQALADSGETHGCPFCGNSQFTIDEACISCGAEAENPNEIREASRQSRQTVASSFSSGSALLGRSAQNQFLTGRTSSSRSRVSRRALGLAGGAILAVSTVFGVIWGNQTYTAEGVVTDFTTNEVTVSYIDKDGENESIVMGRPGNETQIWRSGETLELYFINWSSTPRGAERLDGNVLTPLE